MSMISGRSVRIPTKNDTQGRSLSSLLVVVMVSWLVLEWMGEDHLWYSSAGAPIQCPSMASIVVPLGEKDLPLWGETGGAGGVGWGFKFLRQK